jgi:hypothetical protein
MPASESPRRAIAILSREHMTETENERLIRLYKPQFIRWTDWILDGDAVTYGHDWPSACRWMVPGTGPSW